MTTHIYAVLDRSGSMQNQVDDTIGGYNAWLKTIKKNAQGKDVSFTLHLFDDRHEFPHRSEQLNGVSKLTKQTYYARGNTALLDAFGKALTSLEHDAGKRDDVLMLVMTDGYENASHEYRIQQIQDLVRRAEDRKNWSITFIGANIDTFQTGQNYGFNRFHGITRSADSVGTQAAFATAGNYAGQTLSGLRSVADTVTQTEYDEAAAKAKKTSKT